ncbi:ABC transporter ATP-binding protein [Nevskia soli]|uniref:ABC transporter ATP-binding protein n=1 Tax=Nevskia soli TaxID=418856 RepID=UPI0004A6D683|nr:ABC transporter ATP-binding protein [Nevskia soli]
MIEIRDLRKIYRMHNRTQVVLDKVNLDIQMGQKLALMGRNGAGKSTLIRLIGKVEVPTSGTVKHKMRVSWPLGFTGAFQGSLSGIDNMRFVSRIYRTDFVKLRNFVEEFAELGEHLYKPVKTYSSGMRARLAFALSIAIDFDCYLIDEVILVGDYRFHERCRSYLFDQKAGRTLIIASHDAGLLTDVCDSALVLNQGQAISYSNVADAANSYQSL